MSTTSAPKPTPPSSGAIRAALTPAAAVAAVRRAPWRRPVPVAITAFVVVTCGVALGLWTAHHDRAPEYAELGAVVVSEQMLEPVLVRAPLALAPAALSKRGTFDRARVGEPIPVDLTVYCLKGTTRRGRYVREGIIAADPRIFPLGKYVELFTGKKYIGRFLVDDTGLVIKGQVIDIWKPSCLDAIRWGRQRGTAVLVDGNTPAPANGIQPAAR